MKKGMYEDNGIGLSKSAPMVGEQVDISYSGLLKQSGARNVKLHLGYNEAWEDSRYIEMNLSGDIFMATVPVEKEGMLNFAFTDPVGNWDNNSGSNYSIKITSLKSANDVSPMTGPYDKQPAAKRTARAGLTETNEEAASAKKTTRTASPRSPGRPRKTASPGPDSLLDTQTGVRGRGPAIPIMPEETSGTRKRGTGRKKKEP